MRRKVAIALGVTALLSAGPRVVRSTDRPPAPTVPRSTYVERESSELVLIETYVTDGRGKPVTGLTSDDFILEVGGLRRPILSVDYQEAGAPPRTTPASGDAPGGPPAGDAPGGQVSWPRRLVLFFEDDTSSPIGLTAARVAASRFVESSLAPSDQVAVAAYSGRLRIIVPFTTDRSLLQKSIKASTENAARLSDFWQESARRRMELYRNFNPRLAETLCEEEKHRLAGALEALEQVATSLAGWRGYKAVVYMGNGVPESPYEDVWKAFALMEARHPGHAPAFFPTICTLGEEIKDLSRAASAAGVTIHTVQTWGLSAGPARALQETADRSNALRTLALNTAGTSTTTNDMLLALQSIEEANRSYYVLAYVPQEPADGRYRHIVVRCRRKGVQLRYRKGFTRLPSEEARTQRIEAVYLFPEMSANLGLEIAFAPGPGDGKDQVVDIVVHLPIEKLLFLPQPEGATARLTVGLVAIDETQRRTFETSRSVSIRRPATGEDVTGLDFYCRTRLPAASQAITMVISDDQSGIVGGTRGRIAGDASPGRMMQGLSLYSLAERSLWIELPPAPKGTRGEVETTEPTVGPALKTIFMAGEPIVAGFRLAPMPGQAPTALRVEIARGGDVVRTRTVDIALEGIGKATKVPLAAEGLASGEYVVSIYAVSADGDTRIGASGFRIVEPPARPNPTSGS